MHSMFFVMALELSNCMAVKVWTLVSSARHRSVACFRELEWFLVVFNEGKSHAHL